MPLAVVASHHPTIALAVGGLFIVWRVYFRVRRLVARQRSRLWRHRSTLLLFPMLIGLLALGALGDPRSLAALAAGTVSGVGLSIVGLRMSRFEVNDDGPFFTPYAPLGIGLSALFIARLAYRGLEIAESNHANPGGLHQLSATPMTLLVFCTLASYYSGYAAGLLRWRRRVRLPHGMPP